MNILLKKLLLASIVLFLPALTVGQQVLPTSGERTAVSLTRDVVMSATGEQVKILQERKSLLKKRLISLTPTSPDYSLLTDWIQEISVKIDALTARNSSLR